MYDSPIGLVTSKGLLISKLSIEKVSSLTYAFACDLYILKSFYKSL